MEEGNVCSIYFLENLNRQGQSQTSQPNTELIFMLLPEGMTSQLQAVDMMFSDHPRIVTS